MKSISCSSIIAAALSCCTFTAFSAPTFAITGPSTSKLGESFSLSVRATDLSDLYGYQFDVAFNPSRYRVNSVLEDSFLSTAGTTYFGSGSPDNFAGTVSFVFDTLLGTGPGASGSGILATLNFTTIGAGTGSFSLTNVSAVNSALNDISVATQSLAAVAVVPEPSAWALMIGGLGLLGAITRRRAT